MRIDAVITQGAVKFCFQAQEVDNLVSTVNTVKIKTRNVHLTMQAVIEGNQFFYFLFYVLHHCMTCVQRLRLVTLIYAC